MRRLNKAFAAWPAALLLVCLPPSWADSSVWRVSGGDDDSFLYLGGTVHMLRLSDYPLPEEYALAYDDSTEVVLETDLDAITSLAMQAQFTRQLSYSDGRSLRTVLNDEAWQALADGAAEIGMPVLMLERFKPGMAVSALQVMQLQGMGYTPQGVDAWFNDKSRQDGKARGRLEEVQEQIDFLAAMGEGYESEFILLAMEDLAETGQLLEQMITAWREGDTATLGELFIEDMAQRAPVLYESLLVERNHNWIPQIEQMLEDEGTEFVLVGVAHLVGDDGLISLLSALGYQVEQI